APWCASRRYGLRPGRRSAGPGLPRSRALPPKSLRGPSNCFAERPSVGEDLATVGDRDVPTPDVNPVHQVGHREAGRFRRLISPGGTVGAVELVDEVFGDPFDIGTDFFHLRGALLGSRHPWLLSERGSKTGTDFSQRV